MTKNDRHALGLIDVKEAARLLGVHPLTVRKWAQAGHIPAPVRLGPRLHFWRRSDIENVVPPTSRAKPSTDDIEARIEALERRVAKLEKAAAEGAARQSVSAAEETAAKTHPGAPWRGAEVESAALVAELSSGGDARIEELAQEFAAKSRKFRLSQARAVLQQWQAGSTKKEAAIAAGVSPGTAQNWINKAIERGVLSR